MIRTIPSPNAKLPAILADLPAADLIAAYAADPRSACVLKLLGDQRQPTDEVERYAVVRHAGSRYALAEIRRATGAARKLYRGRKAELEAFCAHLNRALRLSRTQALVEHLESLNQRGGADCGWVTGGTYRAEPGPFEIPMAEWDEIAERVSERAGEGEPVPYPYSSEGYENYLLRVDGRWVHYSYHREHGTCVLGVAAASPYVLPPVALPEGWQAIDGDDFPAYYDESGDYAVERDQEAREWQARGPQGDVIAAGTVLECVAACEALRRQADAAAAPAPGLPQAQVALVYSVRRDRGEFVDHGPAIFTGTVTLTLDVGRRYDCSGLAQMITEALGGFDALDRRFGRAAYVYDVHGVDQHPVNPHYGSIYLEPTAEPLAQIKAVWPLPPVKPAAPQPQPEPQPQQQQPQEPDSPAGTAEAAPTPGKPRLADMSQETITILKAAQQLARRKEAAHDRGDEAAATAAGVALQRLEWSMSPQAAALWAGVSSAALAKALDGYVQAYYWEGTRNGWRGFRWVKSRQAYARHPTLTEQKTADLVWIHRTRADVPAFEGKPGVTYRVEEMHGRWLVIRNDGRVMRDGTTLQDARNERNRLAGA